jgi:hypothetical protein
MRKINVVGHVNQDTDSIAATMGYAWFHSAINGEDDIHAHAGPINRQNEWVLEHLDLRAPKWIGEASLRFESVIQHLDTITPDRSLREAWILPNRTGFTATVVDSEKQPISFFKDMSLFSCLGKVVGARLGTVDVVSSGITEQTTSTALACIIGGISGRF